MSSRKTAIYCIFMSFCITLLSACGGGDDQKNSDLKPDLEPINTAPEANAGADINANDGSTAALDASESSDADGATLTYIWTQTAGEPALALSSTTVSNPEFTLPNLTQDATFEFKVTVSDGEFTASDTVTIQVTAENDAPLAMAGVDFTAAGGLVAALDGTASSDPEGETLTYSWTLEGGIAAWFLDEEGKVVEGLTTASGKLHIPAELAGETLSLTLEVSDGESTSEDSLFITVAECPANEGYLFTECVNPAMLGPVAWEREIEAGEDGVTNSFEYYSGNTENHVQWSVRDLEDGLHNKILDVTWNNADANGRFGFLLAGRVEDEAVSADYSDYDGTGGVLVFDIKIIESAGASIGFNVDCTSPCESEIEPVGVTEDGFWHRVALPVSHLDVDLSRITVPFQIIPADGMQQGVHIQLDNIRWVAPDCLATDDVVFVECLGPRWSMLIGFDNLSGSVYFDGATDNHVTWLTSFSGHPAHGNILEVQFNHETTGAFGFMSDNPITGVDMSGYLNGRLVLDVKVLDYGGNTEGLTVQVGCPSSLPTCFSHEINVGKPLVGEWTTLSVAVSELLVGGGLDLTAVNGISVVPAGVQTGVKMQLDNIRWEK